jgi:hypothetical protein
VKRGRELLQSISIPDLGGGRGGAQAGREAGKAVKGKQYLFGAGSEDGNSNASFKSAIANELREEGQFRTRRIERQEVG